MSDPLSRYFRRLFAYEQDSHAKVLASLRAVPEARRSAPEFRQALDLLAHLVAARRMWLARLGLAPAPHDGFFPQGLGLDDLAARLDEMHALWSRYLAGLTDAVARSSFEYASSDSGRFGNTIEEVLTQLHGHSLYHRGQIASRVRALGCEPAVTDYIYWARKAVPS